MENNRQKISNEAVNEAYQMAKKVYDGELRQKDALKHIHMKVSSAKDYIGNFKQMRQGKAYGRGFNAYSTEHYLKNIYKDYGSEGLEIALVAVKEHSTYNKSAGKKPLELYAKYLQILNDDKRTKNEYRLPEEVELAIILKEGSVRQITINAYERNPKARKKCIDHYDARCSICAFDFEQAYGEMGKGYIHVHHIVEISTIGKEYEIDPIQDLRPVCPNCHAMLHQKKPAYTPEELKSFVVRP